MKKFLLASTALAISLSLADDVKASPEVTLGGFGDFAIGVTDQDIAHRGTTDYPYDNRMLFLNDVDLVVKVNGRADNGLGYGGLVQLRAVNDVDAASGIDRDTMSVEQAMLYLDSRYGRMEMGSMYDVAANMSVNGATMARGSGGIAGRWEDFVNVTETTATNSFVYRPYLPTRHADTTEAPNKVAYITPRMWGLQLGVSYTPDTANTGSDDNVASAARQEDVVAWGLNYTNQFNQIGLSAAFTGEVGHNQSQTAKALKAYELGLNASYMGFTVGGSWLTWTRSNVLNTSEDSINGWTAGASYERGPMAVSVTYMDTSYRKSDFNNLVVSADYKLAAGLTPYLEYSAFEFDGATAGAANDNSGAVVLFGTKLDF